MSAQAGFLTKPLDPHPDVLPMTEGSQNRVVCASVRESTETPPHFVPSLPIPSPANNKARVELDLSCLCVHLDNRQAGESYPTPAVGIEYYQGLCSQLSSR